MTGEKILEAQAPREENGSDAVGARESESFARFIEASPSSFHAAHEVARQLEEAGARRLSETEDWPEEPGAYVVIRDGAVIAWVRPEEEIEGFEIIGAHTDSPGFKLKPKPTTGSANFLQAGVEVYGGPLLNSWLDRELRLAGRLVSLSGQEHLVATEPMFRIPQLAIHLDRKAHEGLVLDRQEHTQPVWGLGDLSQGDLVAHLASLAGLEPEEVGGYDLTMVDGACPARFGVKGEFFASGRMDNLTSVHAGLTALLDVMKSSGDCRRVRMLAAFDHEEIGSGSRSGAAGPFLEDVLVRLVGDRGPRFSRVMASSTHLSCDAGHAVHPNYPGHHDPNNRPVMGGGVLLKINADQRYSTDAWGAALVSRLSQKSGVEYQEFVSKNTIPCGSTIGPITATRLGIRTLDVGVPLLSMHSAREMVALRDLYALNLLARTFLEG